ncbi:MAG: put [Myxococcales bacterium]|nr:put [Myxococcales bacterium]
MTMTNMILTLALALGAGCAVPLSEGGRNVQLMKSDPPAGCNEVGSVIGQANGFDSSAALERAKNDMRNKAATMGANYVRMETANTGEVMGTAYSCPERTTVSQ